MEATARHLLRYGVSVDFYKDEDIEDYDNYDLLHFFNITRPAPILQKLKRANKPYVVSTIYSDYGFYKKTKEHKLMWLLTSLFGVDGIEYLKTVAKHLLGQDKVRYPPFFLLGQKRSILKIIKRASCLLPNSGSEYKRLNHRFKTNSPFFVIPNGVDVERFSSKTPFKRKSKQVLCVALIEPRKNQLNLIKAVNGTDFTLKIIGDPAPNHPGYFEKCKQIAGPNVEFISRLEQSELIMHYKESEIHAMPSWFETTGLASLEASFLGCKVVVSAVGDVEEYLKDYVEYCAPDSIESIRKALYRANQSAYDTRLKQLILEEYNWSKAAEKTFEAYRFALNQPQ